MIPKKIHYCWLSGEPFPPLIEECMKSWKRYLDGYEFIEWNQKNFDVNICQYTKEAFEARKYAFVSDYVRLYALYNHGGIYLDTDIEILKSMDALLYNKAFTGFEEDDAIAAWIFGSEKHNPLFRELLDYYRDKAFVMGNGSYDLTPNPVPVTQTLVKYGLILKNEYQELSNITIYPKEYFCTKDMRDGSINITSKSYAIHHFAGAWMSRSGKFKTNMRHNISRLLGVVLSEQIRKIYHMIKK